MWTVSPGCTGQTGRSVITVPSILYPGPLERSPSDTC